MVCFLVAFSAIPGLELYRMIIEDHTHLITSLWTRHQACCSGSNNTNSWLYGGSHSHDKILSVHHQTFCSHSDEINSLHSRIRVSVKRDFLILMVWSFISLFSLCIDKTNTQYEIKGNIFYKKHFVLWDKILHISIVEKCR